MFCLLLCFCMFYIQHYLCCHFKINVCVCVDGLLQGKGKTDISSTILPRLMPAITSRCTTSKLIPVTSGHPANDDSVNVDRKLLLLLLLLLLLELFHPNSGQGFPAPLTPLSTQYDSQSHWTVRRHWLQAKTKC